jgi:hypothetical protein
MTQPRCAAGFRYRRCAGRCLRFRQCASSIQMRSRPGKLQKKLIVTMDNSPSVSDRSTIVDKIDANPCDSGTVASKVPLKGNANRQHVTLTVLFWTAIITLLGKSCVPLWGFPFEICLCERYSQIVRFEARPNRPASRVWCGGRRRDLGPGRELLWPLPLSGRLGGSANRG